MSVLRLCAAAVQVQARVYSGLRHRARRPGVLLSQAATSVVLVPQHFCARATATKMAAAGGDIDGPAPPTHAPHRLMSAVDQDDDWIRGLDLSAARAWVPAGSQPSHPLRVLVLYGSLRTRSYSRLLSFEFARLLESLGAEVRSSICSPHRATSRETTTC